MIAGLSPSSPIRIMAILADDVAAPKIGTWGDISPECGLDLVALSP